MGYTPSFTPQYENGWEDLPSETSPITAEALNAYDDAIENIEEYLASDESQANLADAYDETATYEAGDYVIYGGDLYKCLEDIDTPEEWDSTKWESCLITDEMATSGGTNVIANPSGEATETLTKLQVENTIYGISGGGGNANIWTGTQAELEEVFNELEEGTQINITDDEQEVVEGGTIYSEEEQVIGLWTDNKPLYQKTLHFQNVTLNSGKNIVATVSQLSNLSIDKIVKEISGFLIFGSGAYVINIPYAVGATSFITAYYDSGDGICMQRGGSNLVTNDISLTITYTKSTDMPLDAVVGKKTMYIASSDCYSTEEKEIGCWTDGKPLYQKTINLGTMPNNTSKTVAHGISNLDSVISFQGYYKNPNSGSIIPLSFTHRSALNEQLQLSADSTNITVITATDKTALTECYVTIQYTKTTDTVGSGQYTPASGKAVHYSTDEQVIGTWIDGKPLYRCVLDNLNVSMPSLSTWSNIFANSLNIEDVIDCKMYDVTNAVNPIYLSIEQIQVVDGGIRFERTTATVANRTVTRAILEYTKTTD